MKRAVTVNLKSGFDAAAASAQADLVSGRLYVLTRVRPTIEDMGAVVRKLVAAGYRHIMIMAYPTERKPHVGDIVCARRTFEDMQALPHGHRLAMLLAVPDGEIDLALLDSIARSGASVMIVYPSFAADLLESDALPALQSETGDRLCVIEQTWPGLLAELDALRVRSLH